MPKHLVIAVFMAFVLGSYPLTGCAQDPAADALAAASALNRGDYQDARSLYQSLLDGTNKPAPEHVVGYLETFLYTGDYEEGLGEAESMMATASSDPYLLYMKGRLLMAVGRYDEAGTVLETAVRHKNDFWRAGLELADLFYMTGRRAQGKRIYDVIYRQYKRGAFTTAEHLGVAGRAAAAMEGFHDANDAFRTAHQIDPTHVQNLYWWAELFREKYNDADAQQTFEDALEINPHRADLFVGYAHATGSFARKEQRARQALGENPNSVGAMNILAGLHILDGQYDAAETMLAQALAVNPASMQALAHRASIHHLRSDSAAFAAVEQQALAINARAGDFYVAINENLTLRFRYPEAVAYGRKGVQVDPDNARTLAALGASLMRVGQAREARRYLDRSFDRDPFNLFVGNTLELLDAYAEFVFLESEHFRLLIHSDESAVLGPAMLDEAEACYTALSARFPYQPEDKIFIEAYNDRGDFDVRVAGVPHIGLLGVSFGDVIALNTPKAQAGRPYNWARTLWHELAHTMAIGVSKHHVPRWFTEGLSVYEEQRARPEWGREMDLEFFTAFDRDKLHRLEEIDRGFTRPEFPGQVLLSYYHASKVIAFIVDQYGFQAIIDILAGLGQGLDQETVFRQVLGQSRNALDTAFRADLQQRRDQFDQVLAGLPDMLGDEEVSLLEKLTGRSENPFLRRLQEGHAALEQADFSTAETRFREALEIYPDYVGSGNPYLGLATVYRERDDEARLIDILEQFLSVSEYGPAEARELGALYADADDTDQALAYLARSLEVEPYDLPTRDRLAVLYEQQGFNAQVVQQRRAILALNPVDKANAYYELARSLYNINDIAAAKRAVLQSLERAPGYRQAQKLLLDFVDNMP